MRRFFQFLFLLLALSAGYVALVGPERLPVALPSWVPWPGQQAPTGEDGAPTPDTAEPGGALEGVTDAALERLVARQPISIQALREREYPGSALTVVQRLPPGVNYSRQVVSYESDGLTIYALLTVPGGTAPEGGWPAIVFNHGYIPPDVYRTTERYVAYQDAFARAGFVTLKSDYRGHGDSQGEPTGGYNDPGYTVDVLNAAASLKRDGRINRGRIGLWGHSMGGQLSLRAMLVDRELRAASLWAGVVAGYDRLATDWGRAPGEERPALDSLNRRYLRALSPNAYLGELHGRPLQLHHGTADEDVPYRFQQALAGDLREAGQSFTAYRYEGDDHNLSRNLGLALRRSVAFFQAHL